MFFFAVNAVTVAPEVCPIVEPLKPWLSYSSQLSQLEKQVDDIATNHDTEVNNNETRAKFEQVLLMLENMPTFDKTDCKRKANLMNNIFHWIGKVSRICAHKHSTYKVL